MHRIAPGFYSEGLVEFFVYTSLARRPPVAKMPRFCCTNAPIVCSFTVFLKPVILPKVLLELRPCKMLV